MTHTTFVLLPFFGAALVNLLQFYGPGAAVIRGNWNFRLGCVSVLGLISYLVLRVGDLLSLTTIIVYAVVGTLLFIAALISTRM